MRRSGSQRHNVPIKLTTPILINITNSYCEYSVTVSCHSIILWLFVVTKYRYWLSKWLSVEIRGKDGVE
jgi:hypothetical protein